MNQLACKSCQWKTERQIRTHYLEGRSCGSSHYEIKILSMSVILNICIPLFVIFIWDSETAVFKCFCINFCKCLCFALNYRDSFFYGNVVWYIMPVTDQWHFNNGTCRWVDNTGQQDWISFSGTLVFWPLILLGVAVQILSTKTWSLCKLCIRGWGKMLGTYISKWIPCTQMLIFWCT